MTPRDHITRAVAVFAEGRPRYWAKPAAGQKLEQLRAGLSVINRKRGLGFRFNIDKDSVMISPKKGKS